MLYTASVKPMRHLGLAIQPVTSPQHHLSGSDSFCGLLFKWPRDTGQLFTSGHSDILSPAKGTIYNEISKSVSNLFSSSRGLTTAWIVILLKLRVFLSIPYAPRETEADHLPSLLPAEGKAIFLTTRQFQRLLYLQGLMKESSNPFTLL